MLWRRLSRFSDTNLLQDLSNAIPENASYEFIQNDKFLEFQKSPMAKHSLFHELKILKRNHVKGIYLVHGTFVGDDPFHIISMIENNTPENSKKMIGLIKDQTKKAGDFFTKDLGNFTTDHVEKLESACKKEINIHNFTWSSANHHYARVKGCLDLIESITQDGYKSKDKILLIGHSHAGQIFSLLGQMIHNKNMRNFIFEVLNANNVQTKKYIPLIKNISKLHFDFVTLGAPKRYPWTTPKNMKIMHFINHRSNDALGGNIKGFINTKDGDYIQQWAVQGSDIISPIKSEKIINEQLDQMLGVGSKLELFKQNVQLRHRLHNEGHHLLINYGDNSLTPNFVKTGFGHGVYTKVELLSFHFHLINKNFNNL